MASSTFITVVTLASAAATTYTAQAAPPAKQVADAGLRRVRPFVRRESPRARHASSSISEVLAKSVEAESDQNTNKEKKARTARTGKIRWVIYEDSDLNCCDFTVGQIDQDHPEKQMLVGNWRSDISFNYAHLHECEDVCVHEIGCLGFVDVKSPSNGVPYCTFKYSADGSYSILPHDSTGMDFWKIIKTWVVQQNKNANGPDLQAMPSDGVTTAIAEAGKWATTEDKYYYNTLEECEEFCQYKWDCLGFVDMKTASPQYCQFKEADSQNSQVSHDTNADFYTIKEDYQTTYAGDENNGRTYRAPISGGSSDSHSASHLN